MSNRSDYKNRRAQYDVPTPIVVLLLALVFLVITLISTDCKAASERTCLQQIAYAEADKKASDYGVRLIMAAAINHAKQKHKSVCHIYAVKHRIPKHLRSKFNRLANSRLPKTIANAWRTKGHVAKTGINLGTVDGNTFFYVKHL